MSVFGNKIKNISELNAEFKKIRKQQAAAIKLIDMNRVRRCKRALTREELNYPVTVLDIDRILAEIERMVGVVINEPLIGHMDISNGIANMTFKTSMTLGDMIKKMKAVAYNEFRIIAYYDPYLDVKMMPKEDTKTPSKMLEVSTEIIYRARWTMMFYYAAFMREAYAELCKKLGERG